MADICTSAITQDVVVSAADWRKSRAEPKIQTVYPRDVRRLLVARRTDASSSMTEMTGGTDKMIAPDREAADHGAAAHRKMGPLSEVEKHT
jgi:hypothetical protein